MTAIINRLEYRFDSVSSAKTTMRKKILDDWVGVHSFQIKRGKQNVIVSYEKRLFM